MRARLKQCLMYVLPAIAVCLCTAAAMSPYNKEMDKDYFNNWRNLSSQQLMERSRRLIKEERNIDTAMIYLSEVVNRYYTEGKSEERTDLFLRAMNNMGYVYLYSFYDYQKAFMCFSRALKVAKAAGDKASMAYLYLNLGNMYGTVAIVHDMYSARQALDYYRQAMAYSVEAKEWECMQTALGNMADMTFTAKRAEYLGETLRKYEGIRIPKGTPMVEYNRLLIDGNQALARKNYAKAIACYKKMAACIDTDVSPERYMASAYSHLAEAYSLAGDHGKALAALAKTHEVIERHNLENMRVEYYRIMYELYKNSGERGRAQQFQLEYYKAKDALESVGKLRNVKELQFFAQLQDANEEIMVMAKRRQLLYVIVGLVCLLTLMAVVGMVVILRKNKKLRDSHKVMYNRIQEHLRNDQIMQRTISNYERQMEEMAQAMEKPSRPRGSDMDDEEKDHIYNKVCVAMADTSSICQPDFSIRKLADIIGYPYPKVSKSINELYGNNFNALLNDYRIKEACRRLKDEKYRIYTIEAIAIGLGFKSRTAFVAVFKRITGLTPSEYHKTVALDSGAQKARPDA